MMQSDEERNACKPPPRPTVESLQGSVNKTLFIPDSPQQHPQTEREAMAGSDGRLSLDEAKKMRKEAGLYIRRCRNGIDLTQKKLADRLGLEHYTFVSSVETGANQVPTEAICDWADALEIDRREFATRLLACYQPGYYRAMFGDQSDCRDDFSSDR